MHRPSSVQGRWKTEYQMHLSGAPSLLQDLGEPSTFIRIVPPPETQKTRQRRGAERGHKKNSPVSEVSAGGGRGRDPQGGQPLLSRASRLSPSSPGISDAVLLKAMRVP